MSYYGDGGPFKSNHNGMQAFYQEIEPTWFGKWKWKLHFTTWNLPRLEKSIEKAGVEHYKVDKETGYVWLSSNDALQCWKLANPELFSPDSALHYK